LINALGQKAGTPHHVTADKTEPDGAAAITVPFEIG
jgi:hypothetical protein